VCNGDDHTEPWPDRKRLLYTGITRGKRLVVLVGQKKAVAIAVRWSELAEWLAPASRGHNAENGFCVLGAKAVWAQGKRHTAMRRLV
jgi:hypothetical protein